MDNMEISKIMTAGAALWDWRHLDKTTLALMA
jgi:hypothetical protein